MLAHYPWHLSQMRSLPLDIKILMSQRRINRWYIFWEGNVYIRFIDIETSLVLKHMIEKMFNDVPTVMTLKSKHQLKTYKYDNIIFSKSFHFFEEHEKRKPYAGLTLLNSPSLTNTWLEKGCNNFDTVAPLSLPLSFWTLEDIKLYIEKYKISI